MEVIINNKKSCSEEEELLVLNFIIFFKITTKMTLNVIYFNALRGLDVNKMIKIEINRRIFLLIFLYFYFEDKIR